MVDNRKRYPRTAKLVDEVREYFPDAAVINTTEWPNWKDIAKTYKGVKIKFDRKWMPKDDS